MLNIALLGRVRIEHQGQDLSSTIGSKACAMIYLMIRQRDGCLSREKIATILWADSNDEAARYNLRYNLWKIKKTITEDRLGQSFLLSDKDCCRINPAYQYCCDMEQILDQKRETKASLEKLEDLYRLFEGDLMEGVYFKGCDELNEMILFDRMDMENRKGNLLNAISEELLQRGEYERSVESLRQRLAMEPYDESAAIKIMQAYQSMGNRGAAIQFYKNFSNNLAIGLGIKPGEELRQALAQIKQAEERTIEGMAKLENKHSKEQKPDGKMVVERKEIITYGKKLVTNHLTKGTGGNLSIIDRKEGIIAITPSGLDYFEMEDRDIVLLNRQGEVVQAERKPSSEWMMHQRLYQAREDIRAIIHAHTTYATVLACLRWSLPATHYMIAVAGTDVPCADYATYGTEELADNAVRAMVDRKAVLLANHGILVGGTDLKNAFEVLEEVEYCAEIYYRSKSIGQPVILPPEEMEKMLTKFGTYFGR